MTTMKKGPQHEIAAMLAEQIRSGQSFLVNKNEVSIPPINPVSGVSYSGINRLILMASGEKDPRWMTKNQIENQGYILKDGAKPHKLAFWEHYKKVPVKGEDGQPVQDEDGKVKTKTIRLERPALRFYEVYSFQSMTHPDGREMPPYADGRNPDFPAARIGELLEKAGLEIDATAMSGNCSYQPANDRLTMPSPEFGPQQDDLRLSLVVNGLCERSAFQLGQVTAEDLGANRPLSVPIAAAFTNQGLGLPSMPFGSNRVFQAQLDRWADQIEKDPYTIFRAAAAAENIKSHLLYHDRKISQGQSREERPPVKLTVPFAEKKEAKDLGAYFLSEEKLWVSSPDNKNLPELTSRWPYNPEKHQQILESKDISPERTYLDVAYEDKDKAKELGGKFDFRKKQWYVEAENDLAPFVEWLSEKDRKSLPVMSPSEEFAEVLKKAGLVLKEPPVMDGKPHKAPVVGQKKGAEQGTYCFMPDASRPSFYMNHHTGVSDSWTYSGQMLSVDKKAELETELGDKKRVIRQERTAAETKAIDKIMDKVQQAQDADNDHPYLKEREIDSFGLAVDNDNNLMGVAVSIDKSLKDGGFFPHPQALITINPDGQTSIEPKSKAAGAAILVGYSNFSEIGKNPTGDHVILVAEDYESGATLYQTTKKPVAVAFGIQNMQSVAKALRKRLPEARITLCVNHDKTPQKQTSLEKANKIADSIGGTLTVMQPPLCREDLDKGQTSFNDAARNCKALSADLHQTKNQEPTPKTGLGR